MITQAHINIQLGSKMIPLVKESSFFLNSVSLILISTKLGTSDLTSPSQCFTDNW